MIKKLKSALILGPAVLFFAAITGMFLTSAGVAVAVVAAAAPGSRVGSYGLEVWIGFDRMWNAIIGGDSRETVSSRLGKSLYHGHGSVFGWKWADRVVSRLLDAIDPGHCRKSIDGDVGRPVIRGTFGGY